MALTYSQTIAARPERVFDLLDDPAQMARWMQGLEETRVVSRPEGGGRVGTRFEQRLREGGRIVEYDGEVLAHDRPHHLAVRIGNPHFAVRIEYRLTAVEQGTRLDYAATLAHHTRTSSVFDVLFRPFTRQLLRKQMKSLKRVAEQG